MRIFFTPAKSSLKLTAIRVIPTLILLFSALFSNAQITPDANGIVYVTEAGTGDGHGWDHATHDLQGAINSGATKVFVAVGNYDVPSPHSFVMKDGSD